jgi:RNA polymerase sigma factor (sigma-70 family)
LKDLEIIENIEKNKNLNACIQSLYKDYYLMLERLVLNHSGQKEDGEDVAQETMVTFIQIIQAGKYRKEANLKSFIYAIAKNIWFTKLKKQNAEIQRQNMWVENSDKFEEDINDNLKKKESLMLIMSVLDSLGEVCSNILKRFYYEELSLNEILPYTNFENEQVLRNKKSKCMKTLMENLEENLTLKTALKHALKLF